MKGDDLSRIVRASSQQPSTRKTTFGLAVVALVSPITYIKPSYADTPPYGLPDTPTLKTLQVISTWVPTTALLYLACLDYMQARMQRSVPEDLKDALEGLSPEEIKIQDRWIGGISFLSAMPLTTPLIKFPLISTGEAEIDIPSNIVLVTVILASNGIAHLRPLQIIRDNPWYGFPITIAKYIAACCCNLKASAAEQKTLQIAAEKSKKAAALKSLLIQTTNAKKTELINDCFVRRGCSHDITLTQEFNQIYDLSDEDLILQLTSYGVKIVSQDIDKVTCKQTAYIAFLITVSHIAALLALGESLGYLADSGFELSKLTTSDAAGWTLAAVPIWAFGVLIHNAARALTYDNLDFIIQFAKGKRTLSWPIKYSSGIFFGTILIPSIALMLLNSSAANIMIRTDFEDYLSDEFIDNYIGVFRWGFVWLATLLTIDIERYAFTKWAKYFGTDEAKKIAHFDEKINNIVTRLGQWKGENIQGWLSAQTPVSREQLLSISEQQYQELVEDKSDRELKSSRSTSQPSPRQSFCEWLCGGCRTKGAEEEKLLGNDPRSSEFEESPSENSINGDTQQKQPSWWDNIWGDRSAQNPHTSVKLPTQGTTQVIDNKR